MPEHVTSTDAAARATARTARRAVGPGDAGHACGSVGSACGDGVTAPLATSCKHLNEIPTSSSGTELQRTTRVAVGLGDAHTDSSFRARSKF